MSYSAHPLTDSRRRLRRRYTVLGILLVLGVIYALVSLPNHYYFRTFAHDLGIFNKNLHDFSRLQFNDFTLGFWRRRMTNPLGDHFEPLLILFSPLRYLFGNWTLLLLQIAAILFGAVGVYRFTEARSGQGWMPVLAMLHYGLIWGHFGALSFDFHTNVIGAAFVPWLVHFSLRGNLRMMGLFYSLILLTKETTAIWLFFICLGLAWLHWKDRRMLLIHLGLAFGALVYFVVLVKWVIASLSSINLGFTHLEYEIFGENLEEVITTILTRPGYAIRMLFENQTGKEYLAGIKGELYGMLLASGGIALLLRPQYLLMALPILLQKVWNDFPRKWGLSYHYSAEFPVILSLGTASLIGSLKNPKLRLPLYVAMLSLSILATVYWFEWRIDLLKYPENYSFYSAEHYRQTDFNARRVREALRLIPDGVPVSAQTNFVPHLTMREKLYLFPRIDDAEYVLVANSIYTYPVTKEKFEGAVQELLDSGEWNFLYNEEGIRLLKRKP